KLRSRLTDPKVEKCVYIKWNLRILKDLGRADELNEVMDVDENLVTNNEENLDQNLEDIIYDLFSDNESITYDENGCIDICSNSQDLSE
ncbi:23033_t:CDS:1, partial [Gigaspora rosea]